MRVILPSGRFVDIGKLDAVLKLPTSARIRRGMETNCAACGRAIVDEWLLGGFKKGKPNMMFHLKCVPDWEALEVK